MPVLDCRGDLDVRGIRDVPTLYLTASCIHLPSCTHGRLRMDGRAVGRTDAPDMLRYRSFNVANKRGRMAVKCDVGIIFQYIGYLIHTKYVGCSMYRGIKKTTNGYMCTHALPQQRLADPDNC